MGTGNLVAEVTAVGEEPLYELIEDMLIEELVRIEDNIIFVNKLGSVVSLHEKLRDINNRPKQLQIASSAPKTGKQVMVVEWMPAPKTSKLNTETGEHKCKKLPCGHFTCGLVSTPEQCPTFAEIRREAEVSRKLEEPKVKQELA